MPENDDKINELQARVKLLISKQNEFITELKQLRDEVKKLKSSDSSYSTSQPKITKTEKTPYYENSPTLPQESFSSRVGKKIKSVSFKNNFEKFIGENLIAKLGILITIIGVVIGAKYSIDNELISPLTRIILGYFTGAVLLGFGIKLKNQYEDYSAILVSGAIAIMYFITFAAYSFYDLFPQTVAFTLMVLFTVFTVIAALSYNREVIAHIGLVGAYAVPFFLSSGSGDVKTLFSYVAIINVGILAIAFQKYWKNLYYAAFIQTWLIFLVWFASDYQEAKHFNIALLFSSLFFLLFYLTFLAYKLVKKEKINLPTIVFLLLNSFIFYGIGYSILEDHASGSDYLGLFTLINAVVHFCAGLGIRRQKMYDKQLFFLVVGLVLVFITLAIPVQLEGNWVTLIWAGEAALLFWIGRTKQVPFYEKISYILMLLGFASILQDWDTVYYSYFAYNDTDNLKPFFNIHFLTSILFIIAFAIINKIHRNKAFQSPFTSSNRWSMVINFSLTAIFLFTTYMAFRFETSAYFTQLFESSGTTIKTDDSISNNFRYNYDLKHFENVWLINYSLLFFSILSFINLKKIKDSKLGLINLGFNAIVVIAFLTEGLYELSSLHRSYFSNDVTSIFSKGIGHIAIKYISYGFLAILFWVSFQYIRQLFDRKLYRVSFDILMHIAILSIISYEFMDWRAAAVGFTTENGLGLSILWGVYALVLIGLGIWKKKKHIRVAAIVLFAITLFKLFFDDISHLNTISKTIVLVSLGVLLLIISFLYTKYKHLIFDEENDITNEN